MSGGLFVKSGLRKVLGLRFRQKSQDICGHETQSWVKHQSSLQGIRSRPGTQSYYDPYMIKWKMLMQKVTLNTGRKGRDEALEIKEEKKFLEFFKDLDKLRNITFPRAIVSLEGQFKEPILMVFGGGSVSCTSI
jgi:hypothetical protein